MKPNSIKSHFPLVWVLNFVADLNFALHLPVIGNAQNTAPLKSTSNPLFHNVKAQNFKNLQHLVQAQSFHPDQTTAHRTHLMSQCVLLLFRTLATAHFFLFHVPGRHLDFGLKSRHFSWQSLDGNEKEYFFMWRFAATTPSFPWPHSNQTVNGNSNLAPQYRVTSSGKIDWQQSHELKIAQPKLKLSYSNKLV